MTNNAELGHAHTSALYELESIRNFDTAEIGASGRRMLLGLFSGEQLSSMACAEVSHAAGLVVSSLVVYPAELNEEDSTASLHMVHALHLLAEAIESPLDMSPLQDNEHVGLWLASECDAVDES